LGPGLEFVALLSQFGGGEKAQIPDGLLPRLNCSVAQSNNVHNPKVDTPDVVGVVVDECGDPILVGPLELQFLPDFTMNGRPVSISIKGKQVFIAVIDVASDADRSLGDEPLFAGFGSPHVTQDLIAEGEHHVRNNLLEGRVLLGARPGQKEVIFALQERCDVAIDISLQALKGAELIKKSAPDDQDVFFVSLHRPRMLLPLNYPAKPYLARLANPESSAAKNLPAA
jgi:hypothetical protein